MLSQKELIEESLVLQLFYLRTLKEFALNIQTSFLTNHQDFIQEMQDIHNTCEKLLQETLSLTNNKIKEDALSYQIVVTPYTEELEVLTNQLFSLSIQTDITSKEMALQAGETPVSNALEDALLKGLNEAYQLVTRFIQDGKEIYAAMKDNQLFSYTYPTMFKMMLYVSNLYQNELNRLLEKVKVDPSRAMKEEVDYNNNMRTIAVFIEKLVDPKEQEIMENAAYFRTAFLKRDAVYRNTIFTPENQQALSEQEYALVQEFQKFLENCVQKLLHKNAYFIIEPLFLDNMLRETNYFLYQLNTLVAPSK